MKIYIKRKAFGDNLLFSDFSLSIKEGKTSFLMAPSGWGKTTLIRIMASLDNEYEGYVEPKANGNIVLFQENRLVEDISVLSNLLALGLGKDKCLEALGRLDLYEDRYKKVSQLSGGMKRRVALSRVLLLSGDRYFLDEPFAGLDDESRRKAAQYIKERLKGKTLVVVSHNKEDSMLMQKEIMATYSKYGVSPMSGCLPILLQTPIWIAMFNFVPNAIELRGQQFLWSDDLSTYDSIIEFNTQLPLIGDHISLFCLLFCGTNLLYSWMNMKLQKDSMASTQAAQQMKMMQWMMMLMPIFFFFVFNSYSAGLNYYYWISLLFSAITMWYLKWRTDDAKLLEQLEKNYEKNMKNPQKLSGMQARLQALQQEAIKQRMNQKKH